MFFPLLTRNHDKDEDHLADRRKRLRERENRAVEAFETALQELDRAMAAVVHEDDRT